MGVIEIFRVCVDVLISIVIFLKIITIKGVMSVFWVCKYLYLMLLFFSINEGYRKCLGFVCMLFNVIIF